MPKKKKKAAKKPTKSDPIKKDQARTKVNKANLLKALKSCWGIISAACDSLKLHRSTFYSYYNNDKSFKIEVDDLTNVAIDFAEYSLFKQINKGNIAAIIFFLKCKAKKRGYQERSDAEDQFSAEQRAKNIALALEEMDVTVPKHASKPKRR